MSEDTYKGESLGKKLARGMTWGLAAHWLQDKFKSTPKLILASREGGDVRPIVGFGGDPKSIIAVDRCSTALDGFRDKFPDVDARLGDVVDVAATLKRTAGVAFLDFCGEVSENNCRAAARVASLGLVRSGVLVMAFQRGREHGHDAPRRSALALGAMWQRVLKSKMEGIGETREERGDWSRALVALHTVKDFLAPCRATLVPKAIINYHSRSRSCAGIPMTIAFASRSPAPAS